MRNIPETIHAYKIPRLNWIFVVSSLLFVASMVWMIWFDYAGGRIGYRKWKDYQRDFQTIEAAKLQKEIKDAEAKATKAGWKEIEDKLDQKRKEIAAKEEDLKKAQAAADKIRVEYETKDTEYKFRKADLDAQKYKHDVAFEELHDNPESEEAKSHYLEEKSRLETMRLKVEGLEREAQEAELKYKQALAGIERVVGELEQLEKAKKLLLSKRDLANKRYQLLTDPLLQNFVNAPFLEIAEPTIRVKQIVLEDQRFNVNFAEVPRVDRCISCHNGIAKSDDPGQTPTTPSAADIKSGNFRFADLPQPHTAHPKLDVFVGESSPHPIDKFGCTSCHWGWDRGMDFSRTAHMPDEEKLVKVSLNTNGKGKAKIVEKPQKEAWIDKYHWHEMHHAEQKMRPSSFTESSCLKCHTGQTEIPHAENLTHGIRLIEQAGCYNCHKMKPLETLVTHAVKEGEDLAAIARIYNSDPEGIRTASELKSDAVYKGLEVKVPVRTLTKTGPSLYKISSKLERDWVRNWLAEPKRFRPNTFMPQFWHLESTYMRLTNLTEHIAYKGVTGKEFEMGERDAVEIDAITDFIFALSDAPKYPAPSVAGDAARGKSLVANLGCYACHVVNERLEKDSHYSDGAPVDDKQFPLLTLASTKLPSLSEAQYKRSRSQGPMLHGSGSKMNVNWLYAWLKDPTQYHPHTKMPNLRLSDQEAADVASFLVTLRSEDFDKRVAEEKKFREKNAPFYERTRDDMVQEFLEGEYPKSEAESLVKSYASDPKKKEEFDAKIADLLRRVKYRDVAALWNRWYGLVNWVQPFPTEISESDRRFGKTWLERLAQDMRTTAQARPATAALLNAWADQVMTLVPTVVNWNGLDEKARKDASAKAQELLKEAQRSFAEMANKESNGIDLEQKKKLYLGEKLVGRYGCYSCHNLQGFDNAKPIGAELTEWGTKLTTTLDFGYLEGKIDHSNYAYVQQKVRAPRSYDKTEVKKPQEWLKMPQFNFNQEQIKSIAIAIMGMTDEKMLPQSRRNLSESEFQIENGRWLVKELNCVGCHIVENKGGAILTTLDASQKQLWPPNLQGVGTKVKPTWLYHFLKDPGEFKYRYWVNVRMPTFGFSDAQVNTLTRYFALLDKQNYPFEDGTLQATYTPSAENVRIGEQIYEKFQCYKCHNVRPSEQAGRSSNIGPNMKQVKERMRPKGLIPWLRNPADITPGVNMPANWPTEPESPNPLPSVLDGDTLKQIHAVADYLLTYDGSIEAKHPTPKEEPAAPGKGGAEYE